MKILELVMLARTMSQRYGVNVQISHDGTDAHCEMRKSDAVPGQRNFTITLPHLKDKGKFDRMVRGYLDHEIGHVRYTDWSIDEELRKTQPGFYTEWFRDVWNILEDVYVEEKMGRDYPGSKINLRWLARNIFTPEMAFDSVKVFVDEAIRSGFIGVGKLPAFLKVYILFKRRAMADAELAHSHKLLDAVRDGYCTGFSEMKNCFDEVDNVLVQSANSTRETCDLAERLYRIVQHMGHVAGRGVNKRQGSAMTDAMKQAVVDAIDSAFEKGEDGKYQNRDKVPLALEMGGALRQMIQDGRGGAEPEDATSGISWKNIQNTLIESYTLEDKQLFVNFIRSPGVINKIHMLQSAMMRTVPGLLQSIQYTAGRTGYVGRVSGRDLYKTGVGNGRIFQRRAERREQRVDVCLLLDASGSMAIDMGKALITLHAMLGMLKSLPKVRSYAGAFNGHGYAELTTFSDKRQFVYKVVSASGGTPTGGAVLNVLKMFSTSNDVRRLLFIITDGEPDDRDEFATVLALTRAQGIEVFGVALCNSSTMRNQFGEDYMVEAEDISELPAKLTGMMKNALAKAVA